MLTENTFVKNFIFFGVVNCEIIFCIVKIPKTRKILIRCYYKILKDFLVYTINIIFYKCSYFQKMCSYLIVNQIFCNRKKMRKGYWKTSSLYRNGVQQKMPSRKHNCTFVELSAPASIFSVMYIYFQSLGTVCFVLYSHSVQSLYSVATTATVVPCPSISRWRLAACHALNSRPRIIFRCHEFQRRINNV